jgi:membrane protein DedA with SNARE-associated domain
MGILASANPPPLPGFLSALEGPLDHYGYAAIALLLLLENIGIPVVPGELAMIAGAIFAGTGRAGLNIVGVGVIAVVASVVGAEIGYFIGRFAGRELILHYGKYVLLKPEHLNKAEAVVDRYGGIVVVVARFIVGLREANGLIAGITQMRSHTFAFYNVLGACAWVATWVSIGYIAGDHIDTIYRDINRVSIYLLVVLVVLLLGYIAYRLVRRRNRAAQQQEAREAREGNGESTQSTVTEDAPGAEQRSGAAEEPEVPENSEVRNRPAAQEDAQTRGEPA